MYKNWKTAIIGILVAIGLVTLVVTAQWISRFLFSILGWMLENPISGIAVTVFSMNFIFFIYKVYETKFKS